MRQSFLALPLVLALVAPASTQEAVRLKNGRFIAGAVAVDESDKEGFRVQLWETGATVFVKWSQIPEAERNRLLKRTPDATASSGPALNLIDGIRLFTNSRDVIGVLVREDATQIFVKTKDSKTPVVVPKNDNLIRRDDGIKIRESDAYSNDEMIEARLAKASEKDYAAMLALGRFAAGLKMYERAKEFYLKAATADAAKKAEIDEIVEKNEVLIKEGKASAALAEVKKLAEDAEFAKAVEAAKKLLADFADTEVARQNQNLVAALEKDAKDFETKKADYLARTVAEEYKAKRSGLLSTYAGSKYKISEARSLANKCDEEVAKYLAEKKKCTPEEINAAWAKREQKQRTATFGSGSWIVKGGQDGGLDSDQKYTPPAPKQNQTNNNNPFGNRNSGQNRNQQQPKPVDLGKKLETSAEWWSGSSSTDRKNFLEAEYAKNSAAVTKEVKTKKCSVCLGEGVLKATRMGQALEVKCPRCHGAKEDEIVVYW